MVYEAFVLLEERHSLPSKEHGKGSVVVVELTRVLELALMTRWPSCRREEEAVVLLHLVSHGHSKSSGGAGVEFSVVHEDMENAVGSDTRVVQSAHPICVQYSKSNRNGS